MKWPFTLNTLLVARADMLVRQSPSTWALNRISWDLLDFTRDQRPVVDPAKTDFDFSSRYNRKYLGRNVDIYVVGSGIRCDAKEFSSRRKSSLLMSSSRAQCPDSAVFVHPDVEGNSKRNTPSDGMTTAMAALAIGELVGVAKEARVISVKVRYGRDVVHVSTVITGLMWSFDKVRRQRSGQIDNPAIVFIHGWVSRNDAFDAAVASLIRAKMHVAIPISFDAGNDMCEIQSPLAVDDVFGVSGTTRNDEYFAPDKSKPAVGGSCVSMLAPAEQIPTIFGEARETFTIVSGTGASTALTVGVMANWLSEGSKVRDFSPHELRHVIQSMAGQDEITRLPKGTQNLMLRNRLSSDWDYVPPHDHGSSNSER
ncbi:hypothetical protein PYCC9005_002165 [Savitreella phatthalungensis]